MRHRSTSEVQMKFSFNEDAWIHVTPMGEFPHAEAGVIQVVDDVCLKSIEKDFSEKSSSENFPGLLVDFDHFSMDADKSSEAAGWITGLRVDGKGLWAKVRWTDEGKKSIEGGSYRLVSPVFPRPESCEDLGDTRIRPMSLLSVALTNDPNIKGARPLTNRASGKVGSYEFSSTQLNLPADVAKWIIGRGRMIDTKDLHSEGREMEPHVTVQYGLHDASPDACQKAVASCGAVPVNFTEVGVFEVPDKGFEVVIVRVDKCRELLALRAAVAGSGEVSESFPDYNPHVTLAYVKPGCGQFYVDQIGSCPLPPACSIGEMKFSGKDGTATMIKLGGRAQANRKHSIACAASDEPASGCVCACGGAQHGDGNFDGIEEDDNTDTTPKVVASSVRTNSGGTKSVSFTDEEGLQRYLKEGETEDGYEVVSIDDQTGEVVIKTPSGETVQTKTDDLPKKKVLPPGVVPVVPAGGPVVAPVVQPGKVVPKKKLTGLQKWQLGEIERERKNEARKAAAKDALRLKREELNGKRFKFGAKQVAPGAKSSGGIGKSFLGRPPAMRTRFYVNGSWYDASGKFISKGKPAVGLKNRADEERRYRWVLGETKSVTHCPDCEARAGQVKTVSEWKEMGKPACRCKCKLVPVSTTTIAFQ